MTNKVLNTSTLNVEKLRAALDSLRERTSVQHGLSEILGESLAAFRRFYLEIGEPVFSPRHLETGDNPRSEVYNLNLTDIHADISRFYKEIDALAASQISSFNYAKVVTSELVHRADQLGSLVLDLKILSDFTRGDVLVAGDDFRTLDNVDTQIATAAEKAEQLFGAGGMSLSRVENRSVVDGNTEVEIHPLAPSESTKSTTKVNVKPTPGNLKRFYEGNYYNFMGQARPEGGRFNIKFVLRPDKTKGNKEDDGKNIGGNDKVGVDDIQRKTFSDEDQYSNENAGFFIELGADEEVKKLARLKMFDDDPSTFWEAEYVYHIPKPLLSNLVDEASIESDDNKEEGGHKDNLPRTVSVVIDFKKAEQAAQQYDFEGRDLIFDIVLTFPEQVSINYVVFDPVIFGISSFPEVLEVSTSSEDDGQFIVVDGWDTTKYAKSITPEANEFLNDTQVGQLLAPTRFAYTGKGVFPFPARLAKRVKIRVKVDNPVASVYERYYVLLRRQLDVATEVKTTTTRGRLRF